jgi:hypothetical protein
MSPDAADDYFTAQTSITEEPWVLPKGWAWASFAEICDVVSDDGKKKKGYGIFD